MNNYKEALGAKFMRKVDLTPNNKKILVRNESTIFAPFV
jgi:hypothetical protein